jgi:hypothetical protein
VLNNKEVKVPRSSSSSSSSNNNNNNNNNNTCNVSGLITEVKCIAASANSMFGNNCDDDKVSRATVGQTLRVKSCYSSDLCLFLNINGVSW